MAKYLKLFLFLVFTSILFSSCSSQEVDIGKVSDFSIKNIDGNNVTIGFNVEVKNETGKNIAVKIKDGKVYKNGRFAGDFELKDKVKIKEHSAGIIPVEVLVKTTDGFSLMNEGITMMFGGTTKIKAEGTVKGRWLLFSKKYPFEFEENISMKELMGR